MSFENKETAEQNQKALVLIVDDVPKNLQLLGQALRGEGYKVAAVTNGEQALESANKYRPDLILLDVMMPGMDGFEVCEKLKANPELESIPVIFLTAKVEKENIVKGLKLGGADYIIKPFNTQELIARVKTHVELKRSRDEIELQKRELEKLSETKDRIYSVVGHDLRGSVNGILGLSELLLSDYEEGLEIDHLKHKNFVELIRKSSINLGGLLNDLLSWARLQTGDMQIQKEPFAPVRAVKNTIEILKPIADTKKVSFVFNYQEEWEIKADPRVVTTITRNFLSNAIKFSHTESVVKINLQYSDNYLLISVDDEGEGMPKEVKEKLFNTETHPSKRGTGDEKGAGFGLLLCNQLARLHGGKIEVESKPGEGSIFSIRIPVEET